MDQIGTADKRKVRLMKDQSKNGRGFLGQWRTEKWIETNHCVQCTTRIICKKIQSTSQTPRFSTLACVAGFVFNQKKDRKNFPLSEDRKIELERESYYERSEHRGGSRRISIAWLSALPR